MFMATAFGVFLVLLLIIGDWYQFTSVKEFSAQYGCGVARRKAQYAPLPSKLKKFFNRQGYLTLPHGVARLIDDQQAIVLRPHYQLFTMRFRTAWPLKGTIAVVAEDQTLQFTLVKRMPWSSALITLTWLGLVVFGTLTFVVFFAMDGGFATVGGLMMGVGVFFLGVLVLLFGLVLVSLAYRLEDGRLMEVYQELLKELSIETPSLEASPESSEPSSS
jgi:hypothetical protein